MACTSDAVNFSKFTKITKFKESQIKHFYLYFRKYAKSSSNYMNYLEFKNSLGVLGSKSNEFICIRLFDLLSEKNTQRISFESYVEFMNLVNYGTMEDKIAHSFRFFDLENKGYIDKDDFRHIILSLCDYFGLISCSQSKIREEDVDFIFEEILEKAEVFKIDLAAFTRVSQKFPEVLDLFDIFNNKILENLTLIINKNSLKKLEDLLKNFKTLENKMQRNNIRDNSGISLCLKSFIERSIKDKQLLNKFINKQDYQPDNYYYNTRNSHLDTSNYFLRDRYLNDQSFTSNNKSELNPLNKLKMFLVSEKVNNNFSERVNNDYDVNISDSFSDDDIKIYQQVQEELKDTVADLDQISKINNDNFSKKRSLRFMTETPDLFSPANNITEKLEEIKLIKQNENEINCPSINILMDSFEFIEPADLGEIKDSDIIDEIIEKSIDVGNCLIISNKKAFMRYISKMKENLNEVIYEINPDKKKTKRRKGFRIELDDENFELDKEDFLNIPFHRNEEKGMIHFGNENVELVLNMMIGIRNSINSLGDHKNLFPLVSNDDSFKELNCFKYSQNSYQKEIQCKFYDYSPKIFHNIRKFYGIENRDYLKSLSPENFLGNLIIIKNRSLRELCSTGKSGSFFYFSYDSKFVLKTISTAEFEYFNLILEDYYTHIASNPNTLLQRFYGMHTIDFNDVKLHFVIMNNVFNTNIQVHYKYDLKGSTHGRLSRKIKEKNYDNYDYNIPLKDLDFMEKREKIHINDSEKNMIFKELCSDSDFLASKNINDYSLLIGIHNPDIYNGNSSSKKAMIIDQLEILKSPNKISTDEECKRQPFYENHKGGILSTDNKKVYFFGVIDIFTAYRTKKKMEHFFKSITQGSGISCKPPIEYSKRFKKFVKEILEISEYE